MKAKEVKKEPIRRFSICLPQSTVELIEKKAEKEQRNRSQMINIMALNYDKK